MTTVRVYSPLEIQIIAAGVPLDGGKGEDEFCKIEQVDDDWTQIVGIDGDITITQTNSTLTKITLTFQQTSPSNAIMSGIRQLCLAQKAPAGPLAINDANGTSKYAATNFWIQKPPDASFSRKPTERQWVVYCNMDIRFDGGN